MNMNKSSGKMKNVFHRCKSFVASTNGGRRYNRCTKCASIRKTLWLIAAAVVEMAKLLTQRTRATHQTKETKLKQTARNPLHGLLRRLGLMPWVAAECV